VYFVTSSVAGIALQVCKYILLYLRSLSGKKLVTQDDFDFQMGSDQCRHHDMLCSVSVRKTKPVEFDYDHLILKENYNSCQSVSCHTTRYNTILVSCAF